ncbi:MAG: hypothetical protein HYR84_08655, partial [Planctomycetes bacterium]|nr:hypothetical protein [Planctomycetota bacterium]
EKKIKSFPEIEENDATVVKLMPCYARRRVKNRHSPPGALGEWILQLIPSGVPIPREMSENDECHA